MAVLCTRMPVKKFAKRCLRIFFFEFSTLIKLKCFLKISGKYFGKMNKIRKAMELRDYNKQLRI